MFWRIVFRSLWGRRARLALALLAVTLGVTIAIALGTLSLQVGDELARALRAAGPNFVLQPAGAQWEDGDDAPPVAVAGATLPDRVLSDLKQTFWRNNLLAAAPEVATLARAHGATFRLVGTYFAYAVTLDDGTTWRTGVAALRPTWNVRGRWPAEEAHDEIALGAELARKLGVQPGNALEVELAGRAERWTATGVVDAGGLEDRWAWAPLDAVRARLGQTAGVERVWVSALTVPPARKPPPHPERDPKGYERYMCTAYPEVIARDLAEAVPGAEALPVGEMVAAEGRVVGRLNFLMVLLALAAVVASALGLAATSFAAVVERGAEIGLLRALGAAPHQVAALLLSESLSISLAGGVLGFLLGSAAAGVVGSLGAAAAVRAQPLMLPAALMISGAIALAATWVPLQAARRVDPVEALRG